MSYQPPLLPPYAYIAGDPPPLPKRAAGDGGQADCVTHAALAGQHARGVTLTGRTQTGSPVHIAVGVVAPGTVRVLLEAERDPQRVRLARDLSDGRVDVTVKNSGGPIRLISDGVDAQIDLDPFHLTFRDADGRLLLEQNQMLRDVASRLVVLPFGFSVVAGQRVAFHDTFTAEPDEHFYGFGEKFTDFDKRGQRLEMWNYDACGVMTERAYKNVPFFVSTRGYGLFVDSVTHVSFDMAGTNHATFSLVVPDTALDYYLIFGPDPKTIIRRYADLVGHPPLLPKWAFGLWVSSGFAPDRAADALNRVHLLRQHGIPADVYHQDAYWQPFGCWSALEWDTQLFPDPEGLVKAIHSQGFKFSLWMDPRIGIQSERFREAKEKGYLLKTPDGQAYVADSFDGFHPPAGNIDFTNPAAVAWFQGLLRPLLRMGVDALKPDDGEKVPTDAVAHNGMTSSQLHNLYALLYNDAVAQVIAEETGRTPVLWARASAAGGQRHAAQWGGDPNSTYQDMASTLRGGLSLGMCGHAFWSHDIGGFYGQPSPDLYIRWAQLGLLSPLARLHGMTSRLPWDYGEEALGIFRDYVRLRYRLLPYIYTCACLAAETSLPLLRPMVLEFPDDPNTHTLDLQYMLGSELLVAPVFNPAGRRSIYCPAGQWVDYWTRELITGQATRWELAPLERLPLYVRANALLPTIEPPQHLEEAPFDFVTFDAYLLDRGSFELHDTDGVTRVSASRDGTDLDIQVEGAKLKVGFRLILLPGAPPVESVRVHGVVLNRLESLRLSPNGAPGWSAKPDGMLRAIIQRR